MVTPRIAHQSDSPGMWPCPSVPACTGTTHLTQSNILASQTSALLGGRASSVSDEVTISYTYLPIYHPQSGPSLALNLYCFYTTISRGEFLSSLGVSIIVIIIPKLYKLFLFSIRKLSTIQDLKGVH